MTPRVNTSKGKDVEGHWDGLSAFERLSMIIEYRALFLAVGLVTPREIRKLMAISEGNREYIIDREINPLFESIDINQPLPAQTFRDKLKTALTAVFFDLGL